MRRRSRCGGWRRDDRLERPKRRDWLLPSPRERDRPCDRVGEVLLAEYAGDSGIQPDGRIGRLATGADVSPDATTLAVRTYNEVFFFNAVKDGDVVNWRGPGKPCFLGEAESQGEAIAYLDHDSLVLTSERGRAPPDSFTDYGVSGKRLPIPYTMTRTSRLTVCSVVILFMSLRGLGQSPGTATRVTPGDLVVDPPTLINLGFEWLIEGDANRNASVAVSYRKAGETAWKNGMPLVRLQNERVTQPNVFNLVLPNMFAGSILDLEPDTAYEARFVMTDPDGVGGPAANATRTLTVRTRPEPQPAKAARSITSIRSAMTVRARNRHSPG